MINEAPVTPQFPVENDESPKAAFVTPAPVYKAPEPARKPSNKYVDDIGNPTWYVKNISGGVITVSDLQFSIGTGRVVDLLQYADDEVLRKSPGIRKCFSPQVNWLKRMTEEEFTHEVEIQATIEAQIKAARVDMEKNPPKGVTILKPQDINISVKCQSMVEKLKLGSSVKPEERAKGITVIEFLEWFKNAIPTSDEIEYMLGTISDKTIKAAVLARADNQI